MFRVYGKIEGKGHVVYIKSVYADDVERLKEQGNKMYVTHGCKGAIRTYTHLHYVFE